MVSKNANTPDYLRIIFSAGGFSAQKPKMGLNPEIA
jgi:hypothetical protein